MGSKVFVLVVLILSSVEAVADRRNSGEETTRVFIACNCLPKVRTSFLGNLIDPALVNEQNGGAVISRPRGGAYSYITAYEHVINDGNEYRDASAAAKVMDRIASRPGSYACKGVPQEKRFGAEKFVKAVLASIGTAADRVFRATRDPYSPQITFNTVNKNQARETVEGWATNCRPIITNQDGTLAKNQSLAPDSDQVASAGEGAAPKGPHF